MEQTTQDKIEAYLKKYGFCRRTGTAVWYMGRDPHTRIVDLSVSPPRILLSTGVQNQEAEECGIDQLLDIKNNVLYIYNASIKKPPGTGSHNPALSQEGSDGPPPPIPNASPPALGGESHPVPKSWKELNPMMEAPSSSVPGSALSAPTPIICDWDKKECKGANCIFYGKTEPILGKVCPLIKPKVYRCTECKKQIDKEQAEKTFQELERALCGLCAIKDIDNEKR